MTESTFTRSINTKLREAGVYVWKISDRFTSGIPDCWYCGERGSVWVEYKWANNPNTKPNLTELQRDWLLKRHTDGQTCLVVVGSPKICTLYKPPFTTGILLPKSEIIELITKICGLAISITPHPSSNKSLNLKDLSTLSKKPQTRTTRYLP